MNNTNREAAQALKDAGFDVDIYSFYPKDGGYLEHSKISADNWNAYDYLISAPDFLIAADWISKQSNGAIRIALCADHTTFYNGAFVAQMVFDDADHRNTAILHALKELKKLKDATK